MGDLYGATYTATADGSNPKHRLAVTADGTAKRCVHIRAILLSNTSAGAVNGIAIDRATAVSGGTGLTEYSLNGQGSRSTPTADAVYTATTADLTLTGGQTLTKVDLAASDRESLFFPRGALTLQNESAADYDTLAVELPTGSAVVTITVWWEED